MAEIHKEEYLGIRHLKRLQKELESVTDRWYSFGEALKIAKSKLDEYESNDLDNSTQLLLVLSHYLNGTEQVPTPTKAHLVAALKEVDYGDVASALEKHHIAGSTCLCTEGREIAHSTKTLLHADYQAQASDQGPSEHQLSPVRKPTVSIPMCAYCTYRLAYITYFRALKPHPSLLES